MGLTYSKKSILSDIIDATSDGAIIIDKKGKIIMVNSELKNIFGYDLNDTLEGQNIDIFIPEQFKALHKDYIHIQKGNSVMGQHRYIYGKKKDGNVIPVYIKLKSIQNYIFASIHDRTNEKIITDDIYQYKLLFDSSIDLLCIIKNNYFIKCNKSFHKILGYTDNELYNTPYTDFIHPDDIEKTNKELENAISFENRYITKDGKVIWLSWNSYFTDGLIYAYARDITSKKEFEKELVDAKDIAQKESKIKSTFVANISHEIRTPINAIIGMASLLETTQLNKEQTEYIKTIINSSGVLLSIINNVLDISKIESGKMHIEILNINIYDFLINIDKYYSNIIKNNVKFSLFINDNVPKFIKGDSIKLQQIITNLINNSIKFTDKGYIYLIVSLDDGHIKFQVKDTGIGISEESQEKLFQPFQQANNSTTRQYGGTGLGLSICKNLVNLMNGHIYLKSTLNFGTTITFEIPYIPTHNVSKSHDSIIIRRSSEDKRQARNSLATLVKNEYNDSNYKGTVLKNPSLSCSLTNPDTSSKIIIVEDHKINQIVIGKLLEKLNYKNYVIFNNGKECIDNILKENNVVLIFMDLHMPIMDGYNCTKYIRDMGINVPIVALTANAMSGEKDRCLSIGMNDFILKPIQFKILQEILSKYVK